jgi:hypothetical protein
MEINFNELVGHEARLYLSLDINTFILGTVKFEVLEDEQDGYRSSMDKVAILDDKVDIRRQQFLAKVKVLSSDIGFQIVDADDNHLWLEFGTEDTDSYYPLFVFRWTPKPSIEEIMSKIKL